ncbi:MAG: serine/threonine-protein kinase RsbW [Paracoccaceae bacterium]|jgi:serine/threonine-protein kinase RsbW
MLETKTHPNDANQNYRTDSIALRFAATTSDVRSSMILVRKVLAVMDLAEDDIGNVELVLAEALNNVVEHACADRIDHLIYLDLSHATGRLECRICDPGKPMPGAEPPKGAAIDPLTDLGDLAEGGFGWMLIRELSDEVRYQRIGEENHLFLAIPIGHQVTI